MTAESLYMLLDRASQAASTQHGKGIAFEQVCKAWLQHDDVQKGRFGRVRSWTKWAHDEGRDAQDIGVDLVADLADGSGWCAVQCKFRTTDQLISKPEIDSFLATSSKEGFVLRMLIDTSRGLGPNAEKVIRGQLPPVQHIRLEHLERSRIDWSQFLQSGKPGKRDRKSPQDHQKAAIRDVLSGLRQADRGKLIMACGTGKTFTALRIAEEQVGAGGRVLFLVPSLSLMAQTITEWCNDARTGIQAFAVCSDVQVGRRRAPSDDSIQTEPHDLAFPATTDAVKLVEQAAETVARKMTVVFATYQSIQVISDAQKNGLPEFDLIICDEAHRTTGVTLSDKEASAFTRVHDQQKVKGKKRLYMTATPRVYSDAVRRAAGEHSAEVASMDDTDLYGEVFYSLSFAAAVDQNLLSDYKVFVLGVQEDIVAASLQQELASEGELNLNDSSKIIGCLKALAKDGIKNLVGDDLMPMRRAVAFCGNIKASKTVCNTFSAVADEYMDWQRDQGETVIPLRCEMQHVDGTFQAYRRTECLDWLKADPDQDTVPVCRILSNARCLSEGVDVPSLDAIIFMHPRKSQMDVLQAVGRVMRRSEGKKMGYVILPIGIPAGVDAEQALNDNSRYQVIWQTLNALRSHDERLDTSINKAGLEGTTDSRITIIVHTLPRPKQKPAAKIGVTVDEVQAEYEHRDNLSATMMGTQQVVIDFKDEMTRGLLARMVTRCGTRLYWENWAKDIADIAQSHITRIASIVDVEHGQAKKRKVFLGFLEELRDDLNPSITEAEAIEMLAQHLVTRPVFDAMFSDHQFASNNKVSVAMSKVLQLLEAEGLESERTDLGQFYDSVRKRAASVESAMGRQKLITELYDKFFRMAFPRLTERLGIVYTPVEVVDFIIHSVNDVLKAEFGQTLGSKNIHILDPFVGTGTFITRLIQSGLITKQELPHKYKNEIHANEIVLLAYYIASINIESVYRDVTGKENEPFQGICLTDTFHMYEQERDMIANLMPDNSGRRTRQKELDIRVILSNPPYSIGQRSANDNAANIAYQELDKRIRDTYAKHTQTTNINSLYDSYIRAIRWGSDRLGDTGIMAYITNAGWVDGSAMNGLRKCLAEEYGSLYVFHLRGNLRTTGENSKKEGGNIFGTTRVPAVITLFVKNSKAKERGNIHFHDIGDYLNREQKLKIVQNFKSVRGITREGLWGRIQPDKQYDWLNQRDAGFKQYMPLGDKKTKEAALFDNYSNGIKTNRDAWCYNASKIEVGRNMEKMIEFYNKEVERDQKSGRTDTADKFINNDKTKISWTHNLKAYFCQRHKLLHDKSRLSQSMYRPFTKQWVYYDRRLNERVYKMPSIFPHVRSNNLLICVSGIGAPVGIFSTLMVDAIPDLNMLAAGAQCFPLKLYNTDASVSNNLSILKEESTPSLVREGISDAGLGRFQDEYPGKRITREDLFYYVYGVLHSASYRERFKNNLAKQLPRIPAVKTIGDFRTFAKAGRALSRLHVGYEEAEMYTVTLSAPSLPDKLEARHYQVTKMRFAGKQSDKDKTSIIYNDKITIQGIPLEAYEYVVNGKSAIEWVMERQGVRQDTASGIINDANRYANETMKDPAYPLKLLQRVITVSLETVKIMKTISNIDLD